MLADLVRTDRHHHRELAGDSDLAEAVKVVARAHQSLIWSRTRQTNALRNALREFFPAALWAFAALSASPGARRCYDAHRAQGKTHHQALRVVANRLVGILHGCLRHRQLYREDIAWPTSVEIAA
jgi:hypothetical protein